MKKHLLQGTLIAVLIYDETIIVWSSIIYIFFRVLLNHGEGFLLQYSIPSLELEQVQMMD